jgi:hypothetical protein
MDKFSVYWWNDTGSYRRDAHMVSVEQARDAFRRLSGGPAAVSGIVRRVMVTDALDCWVAEWQAGKGFVDHEGQPYRG